jgi:hypothetical protein
MHDALTIGIPLIAIIAGILFNRSDFQRLEGRIDAMQAEMHQEFREFYRTIGQHDARLDNLEKRGTR